MWVTSAQSHIWMWIMLLPTRELLPLKRVQFRVLLPLTCVQFRGASASEMCSVSWCFCLWNVFSFVVPSYLWFILSQAIHKFYSIHRLHTCGLYNVNKHFSPAFGLNFLFNLWPCHEVSLWYVCLIFHLLSSRREARSPRRRGTFICTTTAFFCHVTQQDMTRVPEGGNSDSRIWGWMALSRNIIRGVSSNERTTLVTVTYIVLYPLCEIYWGMWIYEILRDEL